MVYLSIEYQRSVSVYKHSWRMGNTRSSYL
ncbi:hypothetical protein Godav_005638 [Gossypium davidsonii]|uniref:Uncharacterized protein n=1 Tax=Gossypium davidsonii TaxID=34287 RepID=A0A7J8S174_GOSDV|nr:hypothetical protein [Gossypium davidsonii]